MASCGFLTSTTPATFQLSKLTTVFPNFRATAISDNVPSPHPMATKASPVWAMITLRACPMFVAMACVTYGLAFSSRGQEQCRSQRLRLRSPLWRRPPSRRSDPHRPRPNPVWQSAGRFEEPNPTIFLRRSQHLGLQFEVYATCKKVLSCPGEKCNTHPLFADSNSNSSETGSFELYKDFRACLLRRLLAAI